MNLDHSFQAMKSLAKCRRSHTSSVGCSPKQQTATIHIANQQHIIMEKHILRTHCVVPRFPQRLTSEQCAYHACLLKFYSNVKWYTIFPYLYHYICCLLRYIQPTCRRHPQHSGIPHPLVLQLCVYMEILHSFLSLCQICLRALPLTLPQSVAGTPTQHLQQLTLTSRHEAAIHFSALIVAPFTTAAPAQHFRCSQAVAIYFAAFLFGISGAQLLSPAPTAA